MMYDGVIAYDFRAVVGDVDEEMDKRIDLEKVRAAPLQAIWTGN